MKKSKMTMKMKIKKKSNKLKQIKENPVSILKDYLKNLLKMKKLQMRQTMISKLIRNRQKSKKLRLRISPRTMKSKTRIME